MLTQAMDNTKMDLLCAGNWMTSPPHTLDTGKTYEEAARLVEKLELSCLPIIDAKGYPVGTITVNELMHALLHGKHHQTINPAAHVQNHAIIQENTNILDLLTISHQRFLVVNSSNKLIGILTRNDVLNAISNYMHRLQQEKSNAEILSAILERAYEGIAVVDSNGILLEFNEAYSRFTGVKRKDAIGRHVTEVIENTNLHMTVKTATPDRGVLQIIQGQPMVVHRIPIWKDGVVVGAIGMLIFEGVSEVYEILDRLQSEKIKEKGTSTPSLSKQQPTNATVIGRIIGSSENIEDIKRLARKAARTIATVLITGESGTGKEVFAKNIHQQSSYFNGPFISVNCGAIPEQLFESELFGYEEGAFTGAKKGGKLGKFELAQNGTIFLDEICELSLIMQTKLLRVLQEREAERVGSVNKYKVNVRVISATNRNIEEMVENGQFREDLYYRLNIIRLHLPPLRERVEDIPILLAYYVKDICKKYQLPEKTLSSEVVATLMTYHWKGNIRELVNTVEHVVTMTDKDHIELDDLPTMIRNSPSYAQQIAHVNRNSLIDQFRTKNDNVEKVLILQALNTAQGNKSKAAELLGIHRTTLYQKLKKYGL